MNFTLRFLALYLVWFQKSSTFQLPDDIKKCHFGEKKCLMSSMNYVIRHYRKGLPKIGLKPLDAIKIEDGKVLDPKRDGGFWMSFKFWNATNYGFENTTINHLIGFDKDSDRTRIGIYAQVPRMVTKGYYQEEYRNFLLRSRSTGKVESEFQNLRFKITLKPLTEYRRNKRFLKVTDITTTVELDRWILNLENSFPGNTDFAILMNNHFEENWVVYWNAVEPTILDMFSKMFMNMLYPIFERVAYDDLFL